MYNQKAQRRERSAQVRGWAIYLLSKARPRPLELVSLRRMLDRHNMPLTRRRLAEEIDYLCGLRLICVFPTDATNKLDEVQQAKLTQRFAESDSDEEIGVVACARLTTAGVNFQDGISEHEGIERVE